MITKTKTLLTHAQLSLETHAILTNKQVCVNATVNMNDNGRTSTWLMNHLYTLLMRPSGATENSVFENTALA